MPTYRFRCQACGVVFERFLAISAADPETCPACGAPGAVKRLPLAGSGLIFKGSGFYITDNRSADYERAAKKENGADSDAAGESTPAQTADD